MAADLTPGYLEEHPLQQLACLFDPCGYLGEDMAGTSFLVKSSRSWTSPSSREITTRAKNTGHFAPVGNAAEIGRSLKEEPSDELTSDWCGGAGYEASSGKAGSPATGFSLNN